MTDRELLESAAKAAGMGPLSWIEPDGTKIVTNLSWNPLEDDGDALRLAVKLGLWIHIGKYHVAIEGTRIEEPCRPDALTATRRAIVRAAAEIGLNIKE